MKAANPASSREWSFGPIPVNWSALPVKYLCTHSSMYGANIAADAYEQGGVRFLRTTDIRDDGTLDAGGVFVPAEIVADYMLAEGDFLISRSGTIGRAYVYRADHGPCAYAGYLVRYVLRDPDTPRWLFHITKSPGFQQWLGASAIEATIGNVNGEKYANLLLPVPPLSEQRAIADYLDRETARLDALVAAKERLLGLLAEKRRALITRAVTRGLNPRASLRDSGVPWLGEIPAHWAATRMKFLVYEPLAYGANEAALEDDPTFPRFVRITDVNPEGNLRDETFKSLPPEIAAPYLLKDGDVLLARSGATVGKAFIYKPTWGVACFAGYLIRCRCNTALTQPDFLFAYTQTEPYWWQVRERTIQATIQNFSAEKYGDLVVTVPPPREQRAIIAHLTIETAKLAGLGAATERTIALLKERRAALIAAAVTGQIDVQGNPARV